MDVKSYIEKEIEKKVSKRALARRGHVSLGTIQNILLGDTETKNSTLEKMCRGYGLPFQQIQKTITEPDDKDKVTLRDILKLREDINELTKGFGKEIGDLKRDLISAERRMHEAAETGDIKLLGIAGGKGK